ncbi:MAG: indole-3-glycerol-phosphate synthase TrpC, partial [Anaerolineae bacterium]|nr:indole-3-glycerol-phosphate synthase TrpC [Anaerolineae bacterium]
MSVLKTGTILDKIIAHKHTEVEAAQTKFPLAELKKNCGEMPPPRDFCHALRKPETVALIAEVKKASPSKGILIDPFHPVELAQQYAAHGASAVSVLTDEKFFMGHLDYLRQIRTALTLP